MLRGAWLSSAVEEEDFGTEDLEGGGGLDFFISLSFWLWKRLTNLDVIGFLRREL